MYTHTRTTFVPRPFTRVEANTQTHTLLTSCTHAPYDRVTQCLASLVSQEYFLIRGPFQCHALKFGSGCIYIEITKVVCVLPGTHKSIGDRAVQLLKEQQFSRSVSVTIHGL